MTSLISAATPPNFYVYSPLSHQVTVAAPVCSTSREGTSGSIIIQHSNCYSEVPSLSSASSKQSNNGALPRRSPGVIVKSSNYQSQYFDSEQSRIVSHHSQSFSQFSKSKKSSLDGDPVVIWHTPSSSSDEARPFNASLNFSTYSGCYTPSTEMMKKCYPTVTQASTSSSYYNNERFSPFQRHSPPINELSDELEFEESVYSRSSEDERSIEGILSEPEIKFTGSNGLENQTLLI